MAPRRLVEPPKWQRRDCTSKDARAMGLEQEEVGFEHRGEEATPEPGASTLVQ